MASKRKRGRTGTATSRSGTCTKDDSSDCGHENQEQQKRTKFDDVDSANNEDNRSPTFSLSMEFWLHPMMGQGLVFIHQFGRPHPMTTGANYATTPFKNSPSEKRSHPKSDPEGSFARCPACVSARLEKRQAESLSAELRQAFGDVKIMFNPEKPRRGSFEVTFKPEGNEEPIVVWTGLKKGPPRKTKFPESSVVIEEIKTHLK